MTADEYLNQLMQDTVWREGKAKRDAYFKKLDEIYTAAEAPLIKALDDVGVKVNSVWDLVNVRETHISAIPVLIEQLKFPYPYRIREGIVRALTIRTLSRKGFYELLSEFRKSSSQGSVAEKGFKWALGNAISIAARHEDFAIIVELITDKSHEDSRDMMTLRLPRINKSDRTVDVLVGLLQDSDVRIPAIRALAKLKAKSAEKPIQIFIDDQDPAVRKEARKAVDKIPSL